MDPLWAKHDGPDEWHPLVAHSADVAALMERLLRDTNLGARMAQLLEQERLSEEQIQRFCVLASLHDAGKCNRGFQRRIRNGAPRIGHVGPIVALLYGKDGPARLADALSLAPIYKWFGEDWEQMRRWLQTTWSHHGAPVLDPREPADVWTDDALADLSRVSKWAREWFPKAFQENPSTWTAKAQHLFNGILTLSDWIASDRDLLKWTPDRTDPVEAMKAARECRAPKAIRDLHLSPSRDIDGSLRTILDGKKPYKLQEKLQTLRASSDGTLTVLESATGSGKTEGAIARFAYLLEKGLVDSMYFAVPTRAAAKQLQKRMKRTRNRIFGNDGPPVHLAVPGYLKVDDKEGTRFGRFGVRWDEDIGARGWAVESSKRYTSSPIAVGTVDQVLMEALRTNHAQLRLAGLSRSFLVVDEVHASSIYMNELLQNVLSMHQEMGGHSLLMSATLGSEARCTFTGEEVPSFKEATDPDEYGEYPLITHVNGEEPADSASANMPDGTEREVSLETKPLIHSPESVAQIATVAAEEGAHVLVIRNTVRACQNTFRQLPSEWSLTMNGAPVPHHSRYCAEDRRMLDERIETVYGKNEEDGMPTRALDRGIVTVATQTVEQSLDIDADVLITDLCPMDVLLQRIGRLHRHKRKGQRPQKYDHARCIVLTPDPTTNIVNSISPDDGEGHARPGLGSVYPDLRIIEATRRAIAEREDTGKDVSIPADNRTLVEEAVHSAVIEEITAEDDRWEKHERYLKSENRIERIKARKKKISFEGAYNDNTVKDDTPTRLGLEDIMVTFTEEVDTPLGKTTEQITLSPYLFPQNTILEDGKADPTPTPDGFRFSFEGEQFTYTTLGIQKEEQR
jgi:CRISPR-associated endonuclease/helicase Cas3